MNTSSSIDTYTNTFPPHTQTLLQQVRATIAAVAPQATEKISYGIPTFYLHGNLIHYAAYSKHIGLYPSPKGIQAFASELTGYKTSKGAVQFPIDKPLPLKLITRITLYCVQQNEASKK